MRSVSLRPWYGEPDQHRKEPDMNAQSIPAPSWARGPIVDDLEVRYDVTVGTLPGHTGTIGLTRADVGPGPGDTNVYAFDEVFSSAQAREVAQMLVHAADLADAG
jgi:hypothetical protein